MRRQPLAGPNVPDVEYALLDAEYSPDLEFVRHAEFVVNGSEIPPGNDTDLALSGWALHTPYLVLFALALALVIVVGTVGNFLVIYVSARQWFLGAIDVYVFNLSVADMLFLLFCVPFQGTVYILNEWPYGLVLCKLAHFFQYLTMYAGVWSLTSMSIDRYVAIGYPLRSVRWRTIERAKYLSYAVWAAAAAMSSPWLLLYSNVDYPSATACHDVWPPFLEGYRRWVVLFSFLISFLLPTFIIFFMAALICGAVRTATQEPLFAQHQADVSPSLICQRRRRRRRVVWLVFALALVYLVCWLPHNATLVWLSFDESSSEWVEENFHGFFLLRAIGHMGTYTHSCLNPIIYGIASKRFRLRLRRTIRRTLMRKSSASVSLRPSSKHRRNRNENKVASL